MFFLLVAVVLGALFALLATQNTVGVPIRIATYTWTNIPLYLVAIISLFVGLFVSWLLSIVDWASNSFALRGKNQRIHHAETTVSRLEARIHDLEEENASLRAKYDERKEIVRKDEPVREVRVHDEDEAESPLHRLKHVLSH